MNSNSNVNGESHTNSNDCNNNNNANSSQNLYKKNTSSNSFGAKEDNSCALHSCEQRFVKLKSQIKKSVDKIIPKSRKNSSSNNLSPLPRPTPPSRSPQPGQRLAYPPPRSPQPPAKLEQDHLNPFQMEFTQATPERDYKQSVSLQAPQNPRVDKLKNRSISAQDPLEYLNLQEQMFRSLSREVIVKENKANKLQIELACLQSELDGFEPTEADIQKLRDEIQTLADKKAQLEFKIQKNSVWHCEKCSFINKEEHFKCIVCRNERQGVAFWECQRCANKYALVIENCSRCENPHEAAAQLGNYRR